jgi:hypothetical protein
VRSIGWICQPLPHSYHHQIGYPLRQRSIERSRRCLPDPQGRGHECR